MLQSIRIRNFRCIKTLTLDLTYGEAKAPNGFQAKPIVPFAQMAGDAGSRLSVAFGLYGPNNSGKSSILNGLETLINIVNKGFKPEYFIPYSLAKGVSSHPTTKLGVTFWIGSDVYDYDVVYDGQGIQSEKLVCNERPVFSVRQMRCECYEAMGALDTDLAKPLFEKNCLNQLTGAQCRTFLAEVNDARPGMCDMLCKARSFFSDLFLFVTPEEDSARSLATLAATFDGTAAEKMTQALAEITRYADRLGLGIDALRLAGPSLNDTGERTDVLETVHIDDGGDEVVFPISRESKGTRRIIVCLGFFIAALRTGKTVVVDELDQSVHTVLLEKLVRIFKEQRINANDDQHKAQIIFTVQNVELLGEKLLSVSDVGIVDQFGFSGAKVLRLCDIEGLRNVKDFRRGYLEGDFGGLPNAYI